MYPRFAYVWAVWVSRHKVGSPIRKSPARRVSRTAWFLRHLASRIPVTRKRGGARGAICAEGTQATRTGRFAQGAALAFVALDRRARSARRGGMALRVVGSVLRQFVIIRNQDHARRPSARRVVSRHARGQGGTIAALCRGPLVGLHRPRPRPGRVGSALSRCDRRTGARVVGEALPALHGRHDPQRVRPVLVPPPGISNRGPCVDPRANRLGACRPSSSRRRRMPVLNFPRRTRWVRRRGNQPPPLSRQHPATVRDPAALGVCSPENNT